ncbi:hypothetical protein [Salinimicrobium soli]|uniref:hypothetical protein n=1 Tax=Salinimicrobium soli TaxID=1254399 RepID=UPI003AAAD59C
MKMINKLLPLLIPGLLMSCNQKAEQNFRELKAVKPGMTINQVRELMSNNPDKIEQAYWDSTQFVYSYKSPPAAADRYQIIFTEKDSTVVKVNLAE